VVLSRYPNLSEIKFETRFWGELTAKRRDGGYQDENSLEVTISLSTLSKSSLEKMAQTSAQHLEEVAPLVSDYLKISKDQVIGVGEFQFINKSLIIELAPEVDLAALKIEPRPLVRFVLFVMKKLIGQTSFSPDMTIITQMQPDGSSSGKLRINSRVFCIDMEDPVVSYPMSFAQQYILTVRLAQHMLS
jgi:hypothetical protein